MMKEHRYVVGILLGLPLIGLLLAAIAVNVMGSRGRTADERAVFDGGYASMERIRTISFACSDIADMGWGDADHVWMKLTPEASARLESATRSSLRRPLDMLIEGASISKDGRVPYVMGVIDSGSIGTTAPSAALVTRLRACAARAAQEVSRDTAQCSRGTGEACARVGSAHNSGYGAEKDRNRAERYYEKACEAGYAPGCTWLGKAYLELGVPWDPARATSLLEKACEGGDGEGCNILATQYFDNDPARAALNYQRSCDHGYASGCGNLGTLYEMGDGVPKDLKRAGELHRKACQAGKGHGCVDRERLGPE